jgi:hypothetical protein
MLLIGGSDNSSIDSNAYVIDVFRVKGGHDHVYSFHGPPGAITNTGLQLEAQENGTYAGEGIPKGAKAKGFPIGYSFLYNVRKDERPPANFMVDWKVEEGYRGVKDKDDIHLRMYAMTPSNDVALADGDPPQNKPGNPKTLGYVLMHRTGSDLNSTFVSVFEPYRVKPFIKSVQRLDNGNEDQVVIKVEKINGDIDYLLYNPLSEKIIKLPNDISMNGTLGYLQVKNNKAAKGILINGSSLKYGKMELKSTGAFTGKIVKMNKELDGKGWLLVDTKLPVDGSLIGRQIIIETKGERDAAYTIHDIKREGNLTKVLCGQVSFISGFKGGNMVVRMATVPKSYSQGYIYDFEEGASFQIASQATWDAKK